MAKIKRFLIDVPEAALDDLHDRLARVRWTDEAFDTTPGEYGVPLSEVRWLADYWRTGYDWRKWEARLNEHPQYTTVIDGQNIHFLHVRSPEPDAFPLILTHGWPGTVAEFLDLIGPLTDPRFHGGDPADAFHVVIPSLPGSGFSGPTTERGWGTVRTANAWAELMRRLGYERYGAHGNGSGSLISPELGRVASDRVAGVHVRQIFSLPSGDPAEFEGMSAEDMASLRSLQWLNENKFWFHQLHSQQPQTLAHALADSPTGLLGWNLQLFATDPRGAGVVDDDFILTNVALHWFTNTAGSAIRFHCEDTKEDPKADQPTGPTTVPLGLATFGGDFGGIRRFADRDHSTIVQWHSYDEPGGHYAAHLFPDVLSKDIQGFFRPLR